ncbi:MAG: asparagine synthase (glutamine-hydrolyzing) [Candidatus Omnitrophota bacterium]
MCGIFGSITDNGLDERGLRAVSDILAHRGPDDEGRESIDIKGRRVDLVHRRLSIIDLSEKGHQPMYDEKKERCVVYNGEVYNFAEIKTELEEKGYVFFSHSDTEVILKSYMEWGTECVHKFRGMFSFAVLDKPEGKFFIFRDHAGIKPLYYHSRGGKFFFSSELKSFMAVAGFEKEIDPSAVYLYMLFGYIPGPRTIFRDTWKLDPGSFLEVGMDGGIVKKQWWSAGDYATGRGSKVSFREAKETLRELLIESFKYRMIADVPVGVFLSGGVDSTLIAALLRKNMPSNLKTFTIGFREKKYDESGWALKVADHLGTEHTEFICRPSDAFDVIRNFPKIFDEPFADSSGIPAYIVSKLSRAHAKVCLSGDGGDELCAGYDRYAKIAALEALCMVPGWARRKIGDLTRGLEKIPLIKEDKIFKLRAVLKSRGFSQTYASLVSYWNPEQIGQILNKDDGFFSSLFPDDNVRKNYAERAMLRDFTCNLPDDLLTKVDRASMAASLEVRVPILDRKVCEYIFSLPLEYRWRKKILKSILADYVPAEFFMRPKKGFRVPVYEWFKDDLRALFENYLSEDKLNAHGFFNARNVSASLKKYREKGNVSVHKLWAVLVFQMWYEKWIEA